MAEPRYILDTGPLVAFTNATDIHHPWTKGVLDALGGTPVTCEIVLAEACYVLGGFQCAVDMVLGLPGMKRVIVQPVVAANSPEIRTVVKKFWPMMDIADACVLLLAERYPRAKIITTDHRDFYIYRRANGQLLDLIHP